MDDGRRKKRGKRKKKSDANGFGTKEAVGNDVVTGVVNTHASEDFVPGYESATAHGIPPPPPPSPQSQPLLSAYY
jgi:hypothetical protein